jgi:hypothetical protein
VSNPSLELDQSMVGSNVTPPAEEHEIALAVCVG